MFCTHCGLQQEDKNKFCTNCGKELFFSLVDKKTDKKSTTKEQLSDIEVLYNKQQENIKSGLTFDGKKIEEKQFPCPFCKKLIVDRSKKCNFCGKKLKQSTEKKQKKSLLTREISIKLSYWVWLISCLVFLFLTNNCYLKDKSTFCNQFSNSSIDAAIALSFVLGSLAFLNLVVSILKSLKEVKNRWYGVLTISTLFLFFIMLFNYEQVLTKLGNFLNGTDYQQNINNSHKINESILDSNSVPTKAPTPKKDVVVEKKDVPVETNSNPDPPVHCSIHENCGGGTTPLKQSECDNSICCQIGDEWIFYKDKDQCAKDQSASYKYTETNTIQDQNYVYQYQPPSEQSKAPSTPKPPEYTAEEMAVARDKCIAEAGRKYQDALTAAGNRARALGLTGSSAQSMLQQPKDQFDRDVAYCYSLYQ